MAWLPWFRIVVQLVGPEAPGVTEDDLNQMWLAGLDPVAAAAAILVGELERMLNA